MAAGIPRLRKLTYTARMDAEVVVVWSRHLSSSPSKIKTHMCTLYHTTMGLGVEINPRVRKTTYTKRTTVCHMSKSVQQPALSTKEGVGGAGGPTMMANSKTGDGKKGGEEANQSRSV